MLEFLFALEADSVRMGDVNDELPLYCALFRFRRECTQSQIIMETKSLIQRFAPIELFSERKEYISWCNGVPVHMIEKNNQAATAARCSLRRSAPARSGTNQFRSNR